MGGIRVLSDQVASQVAAGEVVERPAAAVKELVENSLDAGARQIEVEFARGGSALIRVRDDGCGMDREDALLSIERHATSKIRNAGELEAVRTFGFRGEALPSIASVSRFRLSTRPHGAGEGTEVFVDGGKLRDVKSCGGAFGTTIEVRGLFANLPARRKFLRAEATEAAHIVQQVQTLALGNPGVAFALIRDGRQVFQIGVAPSAAVRARDLLGAEFLARMVEVAPTEVDGVVMQGLFARPGFGRADRQRQFFFLNRRHIHCPMLSMALREAVTGAAARGEHPPAMVFITMDPGGYDCNVHPAKREVRFRRPPVLREAALAFAKAALARVQAPPQPSSPPPAHVDSPVATSGEAETVVPPPPRPESAAPQVPPPQFKLAAHPHQPEIPFPRRTTPDAPGETTPPQAGPDATEFRVLGVLSRGYLVLEGAEGLVLADIAAGRERILYERVTRQIKSGAMPSQALLSPPVVELTPADFAWLRENSVALRGAGIEAEPFGENTVKLDALPAGIADVAPGEFLEAVISEARLGAGTARIISDRIALAVSKAGARGFRAERHTAEAFLRELLACQLPYAAPSGRPTLLQFGWTELERKFGAGRRQDGGF